jgi:NADP-dependent 3-hydroxy acid dehydrogenase YdfG
LVKPIKATMSKVVLITGSSGIGKAIGEFYITRALLYMELAERVLNSIFPLVTLDVRNSDSKLPLQNHRKLRQIRYCYQ